MKLDHVEELHKNTPTPSEGEAVSPIEDCSCDSAKHRTTCEHRVAVSLSQDGSRPCIQIGNAEDGVGYICGCGHFYSVSIVEVERHQRGEV